MLPYSKLKPGMLCRARVAGGEATGRLFEKIKATESVRLNFSREGFDYAEPIPYADLLEVVTPDPFDQIHPTCAKSVTDYKDLSIEQLVQDPAWVMEEKFDGWRIILAYFPQAPEGVGSFTVRYRATTRVLEKHTGELGDLTQSLPQFSTMPVCWDGPSVFDGEVLHRKGETREERFRRVGSILGSSPAKALADQEEHGPIHVTLFDALWLNGADLRDFPWEGRRACLEAWYERACAYADQEGDTGFRERVTLSEVAYAETEKRVLLDRLLADGAEGGMGKFRRGRLLDTTTKGNRSPHVLKMKAFVETDVLITGFRQGEGMYNTDRFGAIEIAQYVRYSQLKPGMKYLPALPPTDPAAGKYAVVLDYGDEPWFLVNVGTCGGFTQAEEAMFRADPLSFIGQPMEVSYQEGGRWSDTAKFRHAHFVRMRSGDKNADECVYEPGA
jgi:ATP-dependent DNA ligase